MSYDLLNDDGDELIGQRVGGFLVKRLLGRGGMGKVFEAEQVSVGRLVALKVLKASLHEDDRLHQRFAREAQAIAQLNHPNIVTLYDFGVDEHGASFIAMEFVDGIPLSSYLGQQVDITFITHVFRHILTALREAHTRGIVHRDLKPDNVMLATVGADDAFAKVLDFGLARLAADDDMRLTHAGEVFGTPLYMSPEQASGEEEMTPSTDLYSLGCMIYELVTGGPPFTGRKTMHVLMKHVHEPPSPLLPMGDLHISESFEALVMACLEKRPEHRPESAEAALEWLHSTPEAAALAERSSPGVPAIDDSLAISMSHSLSLEDYGGEDLFSEVEIEDAFDLDSGIEVIDDPNELRVTSPPSGASSTWSGTSPDAIHPAARVHPEKPPSRLKVGLALVLVFFLAVAGAFIYFMYIAAPPPNAPPPETEVREVRSVAPPTPSPIQTQITARDNPMQNATRRARGIVNQGFSRGLDRLHQQTIVTRFEKALGDVEAYTPPRKFEYRPLLASWSWSRSVHHRHMEVVPAARYVDPLTLLFGASR